VRRSGLRLSGDSGGGVAVGSVGAQRACGWSARRCQRRARRTRRRQPPARGSEGDAGGALISAAGHIISKAAHTITSAGLADTTSHPSDPGVRQDPAADCRSRRRGLTSTPRSGYAGWARTRAWGRWRASTALGASRSGVRQRAVAGRGGVAGGGARQRPAAAVGLLPVHGGAGGDAGQGRQGQRGGPEGVLRGDRRVPALRHPEVEVSRVRRGPSGSGAGVARAIWRALRQRRRTSTRLSFDQMSARLWPGSRRTRQGCGGSTCRPEVGEVLGARGGGGRGGLALRLARGRRGLLAEGFLQRASCRGLLAEGFLQRASCRGLLGSEAWLGGDWGEGGSRWQELYVNDAT
jgi:hypothetical protein